MQILLQSSQHTVQKSSLEMWLLLFYNTLTRVNRIVVMQESTSTELIPDNGDKDTGGDAKYIS